jgi:hypothetical protein
VVQGDGWADSGNTASRVRRRAGRPLQTRIPGVGDAVPVVAGLPYGGMRLLPFVGAFWCWQTTSNWAEGSCTTRPVSRWAGERFPVLTGYYGQDFPRGASALMAGVAAFSLSLGQRALSVPVRTPRRRTRSVYGRIMYRGGAQTELDRNSLLGPLESALRAVAYGLVTLAVAMVASRL